MIFPQGRGGAGKAAPGVRPAVAAGQRPAAKAAQPQQRGSVASSALAPAGKGGWQAVTQTSLDGLEQQLSSQANAIYENILNLNVSMSQLSKDWDKLMALRSKILIAYGVPAKDAAMPKAGGVSAPAGKGAHGVPQPMQALLAYMGMGDGMGGMGGMGMGMGGADWWGADAGAGAFAAIGGAQDTDYKSKLNQVASKRLKRPLTKADLVYNVQEAEGGSGYMASLIGAEALATEYWSPAPAASKRAAEHAAAKAALSAEFPEALAGEEWGGMWNAAGQPPSKKRKLDPSMAAAFGVTPAVLNEDPKSQLARAAQLLLGRSCGKTDIVYEVVDLESPPDKRYQATVVLPEYNPQAIHKGLPAESIKQAQMNAAQVAITAWKHLIDPLEEERKAKKAAQNKEKLEALKARKAGEKAAAASGVMAE